MSKTVVGLFEYENDAQNAQNYLLANGFGDGAVDIKIASYQSGSEPADTDQDSQGVLERIGAFFHALFTESEKDPEPYLHAGKHNSIVTVHATSDEEALEAARVLDQFGAVDVEKGPQGTRSLIVQRPVPEHVRLRHSPGLGGAIPIEGMITGTSLDPSQKGRIPATDYKQEPAAEDPDSDLEAVTLNKTVEERDALIDEIVNQSEAGGGGTPSSVSIPHRPA